MRKETAELTRAPERTGPVPRRPLRIVHVINYIARSGGLEKGVALLIRGASPDIEHVIITIQGSNDPYCVIPEGTPIHDLAKPPGNSLRSIWKLSRMLKSLAPCVVHTRNWPGLDGIVAARLAGIKSVVHSEEGWNVLDLTGASRKRILVRRFLSRWTRTFVSVSKDIEAWLKGTVRIRCPVVQIYNGLDTGLYAGASTSAELKRELGLAPDTLLVGIVARFDPIKDHPTLFRAFAEVRKRFPKAELLCVGDGAERGNLEKLVTPGIRLLGERHDVPRILRGLDLFTLVSRNEGIPYTILEAMAAGLPIVASRVGGNPELVEEGVTGRLFPAGDAAALADAIGAYLADAALRAAHGAAARKSAVRRFETAEMVRAYENVWRACAASSRPGR